MQVPTRKPGKYSHLKPDPHLTPAKLNELKMKLERLKRGQPPAIAEVKRLAADGDFSENAAYQMAKGRLRGLNQRILEIENQIKQAIIISEPKNQGTVGLGSIVTVESGGRQRTYEILGSVETDPGQGVISHNSPLGSALIGRRAGETVTVRLAERTAEYKILKIS